jgi:hypothetical protein
MTTPVAPENGTVPAQRPARPAPSDAVLHRRARAALTRSAAVDRTLAVLIGLVLMAAGVLVALLSYGVFGVARAGRPLLDPLIVDAMRAQPDVARLVVLGIGVLLVLLGLMWAARSLRPERHPDLVLDGGPDTAIVISSSAVADAISAQVNAIPGVGRARARLVGTDEAPALRLTLWLADDAEVRSVLARLHDEVLGVARDSLGIAALPTAVRLELDTSTPHPRVA